MLYFVTRNKSTSERTELNPDIKYDQLATIIIDSDVNGNGKGEYRFIDAYHLRQSPEFNSWKLGSSILMHYGWASSTLFLSITDRDGKTNEVTLEVNVGCRSSYWGVTSIQAIISKFNTITKYTNWKDYEIGAYKVILTNQINYLLLQKEEIDNRLAMLKSELETLIV